MQLAFRCKTENVLESPGRLRRTSSMLFHQSTNCGLYVKRLLCQFCVTQLQASVTVPPSITTFTGWIQELGEKGVAT